MIRKLTAALAIAAFLALIVLAAQADAHTLDSQTPTCPTVVATLSHFPGPTATITLHADSHTYTATLTGTTGTVTFNWSAQTALGGVINGVITWTADGGGHGPAFTFDATSCVPPTTTSTTIPRHECIPEQPAPCQSTTTTMPPSTSTSLSPFNPCARIACVPTPVPAPPKFAG